MTVSVTGWQPSPVTPTATSETSPVAPAEDDAVTRQVSGSPLKATAPNAHPSSLVDGSRRRGPPSFSDTARTVASQIRGPPTPSVTTTKTDGTPIALTDTAEAAYENMLARDLRPVTVH